MKIELTPTASRYLTLEALHNRLMQEKHLCESMLEGERGTELYRATWRARSVLVDDLIQWTDKEKATRL